MPSDLRAAAARQHHRAAAAALDGAREHRAQRDTLVRALHAEGGWTQVALARAIGCTPELIAKILRPQRR